MDAKTALNVLAQITKNTVLVWIKAHVGHEGNEAADELAKLGTTSTNYINLGIPACESKRLIDKLMRSKWNREWKEYGEGKHSKEFLQGNCKSKTEKDWN